MGPIDAQLTNVLIVKGDEWSGGYVSSAALLGSAKIAIAQLLPFVFCQK